MLSLAIPVTAYSAGLSDTAVDLFSDSARFERWSHFKDYGIPGTVDDVFNQAAIADGSCRLVEPAIELDGSALFHEPTRVKAVLAALKAAPATDRPSYFVRATKEALRIPCSTPAPSVTPKVAVSAIAAGMQNWYHALCAPETDPSWKGTFDPAEQPQQMALTSGFLCISACDATKRVISAKAMASLSADPSLARDQVCQALPWGSGVDFSKLTTTSDLAKLAAPLLDPTVGPCACPATAE